MAKKIALLMVLVIMLPGILLAAGCGDGEKDTTVEDRASEQITAAEKALSDAAEKGVQVPDDQKKMVSDAQSKLESDSVEALVLATTARANIENDVADALNMAEQTYSISRGTAEGAVANATQGADLAQANESLKNAEARKAAAKTIQDWYNPSDGPIYWANLAGQQAVAASKAAATTQAAQAAAAEAEKRVQQSSAQILSLMNKYLSSNGYTPADYKLGITKISASNPNWITGAATPLAPMPGSTPVSFLFQYEGGNWVLRAAPSWTAGQFGAPADMLP